MLIIGLNNKLFSFKICIYTIGLYSNSGVYSDKDHNILLNAIYPSLFKQWIFKFFSISSSSSYPNVTVLRILSELLPSNDNERIIS